MLDVDTRNDKSFKDTRQTNDSWNDFRSLMMDEQRRQKEIKQLLKVLQDHMANIQNYYARRLQKALFSTSAFLLTATEM